MKTIASMALGLLLVAGCTTTNFVEHRGAKVFEGSGGSCRNIHGIDFWEIGTPDGNYEIIGYIQQSSYYDSGDFLERAIVKSASKKSIAAEAKKHRGDAVIFMSSSTEVVGSHSYGTAYTSGYAYPTGFGQSSGSYNTFGTSYSDNQVVTEKRLAVIRYLK